MSSRQEVERKRVILCHRRTWWNEFGFICIKIMIRDEDEPGESFKRFVDNRIVSSFASLLIANNLSQFIRKIEMAKRFFIFRQTLACAHTASVDVITVRMHEWASKRFNYDFVSRTHFPIWSRRYDRIDFFFSLSLLLFAACRCVLSCA